MSAVLFFIAAIGALAGAIGVVMLRNPFYSVLALVGHLISLAALFLLLRAEFVAAAQVVVYAGAVMVLYVFVVSYIGKDATPLGQTPSRAATLGAFACGAALVVELFIAVLGASNLTYAEASWTQGLADWIGLHTRAFTFFGGVSAMVVSDNLKSGITKACFYEPAVNRAYAEMAAHYDTAVVPARPYKPRDKAKSLPPRRRGSKSRYRWRRAGSSPS